MKFLRLLQLTSLNRSIWRISLPVSFSMVAYTGVMVSDTFMVGKLGGDALASAGIGGMVSWIILSFFLGASSGVQIIAARRYGEKNYTALRDLLYNSLFVSLLVGAIVSLLAWHLSEPIIEFLSAGRNFSQKALSFVRIRFLGITLYFILFILRAFFDGMGKTYIGFLASFGSMVANIFLNWLFIYGNWGFAALGTDGAALASTVAALPGLSICFLFFLIPDHKKYLRLKRFRLRGEIIYAIGRVALPVAIDSSLLQISFTLFYRLAALVDTVSVAATNLIISILSVAFMPGYGFSIAATTILGQAVAKGKFRLAYHSTYRTAHFSAAVMGSMGLLFLLLGLPLLQQFSAGDQDLVSEAWPALILAALMQVADAYQMVLGSALRSAGRFYWVLAVYTSTSLFIMLPLAYVGGILFSLRTVGLWSGVAIWLFLTWLFFKLKFDSGDWKGRAV